MRFIKSIAILLLLLLITSCYDYSDEGKYWSEEWTATMNIDGSEIDYLLKGAQTPFYVADLSNPGQEKIIMSSSSSVYSLNSEGTLWEGILLDVGNIVEISQDRTKMVMEYNYDIYVANVDGTGLRNLTNTPDLREDFASISADNSMVVYNQWPLNALDPDELNWISINGYNLNTDTETILLREETEKHTFIREKCIISDKIFYYKWYELNVKPRGIYNLNMSTLTDSLVYSCSSTGNIISNSTDAVYFLASSEGIVEMDINTFASHDLIGGKGVGFRGVLSFNPTYEYLAFCGDTNNGNDWIYSMKTGDIFYLPKPIGYATFNLNSTKIISVISRRHPDDF